MTRTRLGILMATLVLAALAACWHGRTALTAPGDAGAPADLLAEYLAEPDMPDTFVYAARPLIGGIVHAYETFGWQIPIQAGAENPPRRNLIGLVRGAQLRVCNLRTREDTVILEDADGSIRDPYVHYDGEHIVFSYRPGAEEFYHLYEIKADGTGLRQITRGNYDDVEPCYLPDGGIAFVSSRARRWVPCFVTQVGLIYRCDADGGTIRQLTCNMDHDLRPWVMADGRLLFTRWEYIDRHEEGEWDLWAMRPDGSGAARLYSSGLISAKPVPGADALVAISANKGSTNHVGGVVLLDLGRDSDAGELKRAGEQAIVGKARDPYAVSARWFFYATADGIQLLRRPSTGDEQQQMRVIANPDNTALLAKAKVRDRGAGKPLACHEIMPLAPRPRETVLPPVTDWTKTTGRLFLADAHRGQPRSLGGLASGDVASIAIYEQLPVPVKFSDNTAGQCTMSSGWTLKRYLGTFPVEADGSAYVEVPGRRLLQLVALDTQGMGIKRMHGGISVMPGETLSCVGCHENRSEVTRVYEPRTALTRPARHLTVEPGVPEDGIVDYTRVVQPMWDKHCVRCHNADTLAGKLDLSRNRGPFFTLGAHHLVWKGHVSLPADRGGDNPGVRRLGSPASSLLGRLQGGHQGVKLSEQELRLLQVWIDGGGMYAPTYACNDTGRWRYDADMGRWPVMAPKLEAAVKADCLSCHGTSAVYKQKHGRNGPNGARRTIGGWSDTLLNITAPQKSLLIRAPLAKEAGGLGWCVDAEGKPAIATTDDPRYQALLPFVPTLGPDGRVPVNSFELPGFRALPPFITMMRRFGALAPDAPAPTTLDEYIALDQAYYQLFHPGGDDSGEKIPAKAE